MKNPKKIIQHQSVLRNNFFLIGLTLLSLVFSTVSISSILFLLGISINILSFISACLLTVLSTFVIGTKKLLLKPRSIIITLSVCVLIFIFSIFINSLTMETTWDGNWYHKTAVGMLKNGWNPVRESATDFYDSDRNPVKTPRHEFQDLIYENHYTKGSWIFAANIYKLTNNIETGHSINLVVMISVFCLLVSILLSKTTLLSSILISTIAVFNPVAAPQTFIFYNDGLLGILIISLIISLILIVSRQDKTYPGLGLILFFMSTTLLINTKFTGLMFVGFYSLSFFIYILISPKLRQSIGRNFFITGALSALFALLIVGSSSYLSNLTRGYHPLHPLAGPHKVDIMTPNSPREFANTNKPFVPFLKSLFGKLDSFSYASDKSVQPKLPFKLSASELQRLSLVDARISGNGIFFSGLFLISTILIICWLKQNYHSRRLEFNVFLCILLPTGLIILIFKEMWWARYLPHFYAIISLAMYTLLDLKQKKELATTLFYGLFFIGLINSYLFFAPNLEKGLKTKRLSSCGNISQKSKVTYRLSGENFYGTLYNIADCKRTGEIELEMLSKDQTPDNNYSQGVVPVPGYLEVFYEK